MPAEEDRHVRTFMAWPALSSVWGNSLGAVRRDIAKVAYAISRYEPVVMLARPSQAADARYLCGSGAYYGIDVIEIANDDLWIRDFGPTFVVGPGAIAGVDTNFNGWGKTAAPYAQPFTHDAAAAETLLGQYGVNRIQASFVGEGGSLETDGQGTLLATVSSLVNGNRNPGQSQDQVEQAMRAALGIDKVIWVPGLAARTSPTATSTASPASRRPARSSWTSPAAAPTASGSPSTRRPRGSCAAPPTRRGGRWPSPNSPVRIAAPSAGKAMTSCRATPTTTR